MLELAVFEQCSKNSAQVDDERSSQSEQRIHGNTAKYFWDFEISGKVWPGYLGWVIWVGPMRIVDQSDAVKID